MILVDTSVLSDVLTEDPQWLDWSSRALADAANRDDLAVNAVILAELAPLMDNWDALQDALPRTHYSWLEIPWKAAWIAGRAHLAYRRRGGARVNTLPDFFIGAHAEAERMTLLTRDPARFRTYFPKVRLVSPSKR